MPAQPLRPANRDAGENVLLWVQRVLQQDGHVSRFATIRAGARIAWGLREVPGYATEARAFLTRAHNAARGTRGTTDGRQQPTFNVQRVIDHWQSHPAPAYGTTVRDRAVTALAISSAMSRQEETTKCGNDVQIVFTRPDGSITDPVDVTPAMRDAPLDPSVHALFVYTTDKGTLLRGARVRVPFVVVHFREQGPAQPVFALWAYMQGRGTAPGFLFPKYNDANEKLDRNTISWAIRRTLTAAGIPVRGGTASEPDIAPSGVGFTPSETRKAAYAQVRQRVTKDTAKALGRWAPSSDVPDRFYARESWRGIAPYPTGRHSDGPRRNTDSPRRNERMALDLTMSTASAGRSRTKSPVAASNNPDETSSRVLPATVNGPPADRRASTESEGSGPGPVRL